MEAFDVLTKWEAGTDSKNPTKVVNIFKAKGNTKKVVKAHVNLVWTDTAHRSATIAKYFKLDTKVQTGDVDGRVAI
eukprot:4832851-Ditylum_brightwellii.AAC.1